MEDDTHTLRNGQRIIADLRQGKFDWIAVDFPPDPRWDMDPSYTFQCEQYHSMYKNHMPMVPSVMTHCDLEETRGESQSDTIEISYRSMVLEPQKWILHIEHIGDPINGSEDAGKLEINHEETTQFTNSFEFSSKVGVHGYFGSTEASVAMMSHTRATWEKKVLVKEVVQPECSYQPTAFYAKFLCKVVLAKEGEFLLHSTGKHMITTNPRGIPSPGLQRTFRSCVLPVGSVFKPVAITLVGSRLPHSQSSWWP